ncbi:MAG: hypothetical protein MZU84_05985 [Sphingobacterium sp.]|nr:hypothetical protein [Sphingobacterium sp.]
MAMTPLLFAALLAVLLRPRRPAEASRWTSASTEPSAISRPRTSTPAPAESYDFYKLLAEYGGYGLEGDYQALHGGYDLGADLVFQPRPSLRRGRRTRLPAERRQGRPDLDH